VSGLVIFFPAMCVCCAVRVSGEFVKLDCSLVRIVWHVFSRPQCTPQPGIFPVFSLSNCEHTRSSHALPN
jgi:hypothetical protein